MTSRMEKHSKANNSKHKKMKGQAIEKSPHTKNHNQNHFHKHSDNESHDTHSTEEDCVFNDPPRDSRHHRSRLDRQSHRSFSTSSTSITSSSSTSSVSSSSVSTSSPSSSSSSTSSTSSPSSSSDIDSDSSHPRVEPRHYRSCTDIPKKERYFDECDDTAPLLAKGEHVERNQKHVSVPKHGSSQGKHKISRDGSVRKAKSMESLARTKEKEPQDDAEQEKRSNEARKNIVKEKIKFSAFLNEITRQVLSPMRLTSLGVANPHRPRSPVQSTKLENTRMKQTEQQRHLQGSADSTSSEKHSHSSTKHSHSHQRHYSHRSEGSPDRKRSSFKRHHSWHRSCSPSDKHHRYYHHHHQYSDPGNEKEHYRHDHSPTYDTRTSRHKTKHHHRHNSDHQPNTSHCYKDCEHNQKSCHGDYRETRCSMSPTHHRHHSEARHSSQGDVPKCKDKDSSQEELHFEEHHHSHQPQRPHRHQNEHNHLRKKRHGSNHSRHHNHQYESAHHHGNKDHHESHHHHGDHHQHGDRYSDPHHHGDSHSEGHHHRRLHSEAHNNQRDHYGDQNKDLHGHHRDHNREHHHQHGHHNRELHHHHGDQKRDSDHHHGDQNKNSHHHHGEKNREPPYHHGDNDSELHHLHGDRHIESHNHHHHRDHEKQPHHHHGDRSRESHHRHGDHNRAPHYHHGDHKKEPHHHHGDPNREPHHHHGDHNREPHHHHGNPEREPHHHGDSDREPHHYHGDHDREHHHHHGDHDREPHHHHGDHDREPHHHHGDHDREHHHHHEDHPSQTSHQNLDDHYDSDQAQSKKNLGLMTSHHGNPVKSPDTLRPVSASSQEEEQTSFSNPLHNETTDGMGRIIILQEQNEGLQQSLLKTAVRVECLGEEFMSSRHCLEAELQKTRMELSNLTERFKRLHDNCSSTQQTNSLLEHKLHLVSQNMEGERKRLNTRISALTERLADAKFVNNMDTGKARQHQIQSDDDPTDSPVAPPPAQFMDMDMNYNKDNEPGQEQCLGSVPEEEESDWSEIGEETPRFVLMGLNRGQAWRRSEGDEDKVSGLGKEEIFQAHSSRPSTIPQLQFTVHNDALPLTQTLSDIVTRQSSYKITTDPSLGSAVLVRSASLEEIPLPRRTIAKELRGTEAMMDLHHSGVGAGHDLDNEFIHHLKSSRETALGRDCGVSEMDAAMSNLQSAERILNHLISETQQTEAEVHGWSQAIPDELLKGERTKL